MLSSLSPWKPTQHGELNKSSSSLDIWDVDVASEEDSRISSYIV